MKNLLSLITLLFFASLQAQETGAIAGKLTDKEINDEPLPFANIIINGTSQGTTSDYDGLYLIDDLKPGIYTITISFIGYETRQIPNVKVEAGKITEVNAAIGIGANSLNEIVISTVSRKDSQVALLLEQKGAIDIKESIGAQELKKLGVSDVATATTKISGVTSSEGSGGVFVRGLGDRYLFTSLNGLPIPSDDVERKNIDLELFPTRIISDVSISKTYSAKHSADQASGNIDISSRELVGNEELSAGVSAGVNTNVATKDVWYNFKSSPNLDETSLGFYKKEYNTTAVLTEQSWNTIKSNTPINSGYSITLGKKFDEKLKILATASQSISHSHKKGVFREFRANFINDSITDTETFQQTVNTTGLANASYELSDDHEFRFTTLFINKLSDEVFEGGRNGEATIFEETNPAEGFFQFIRDQNTKQVRLWINQLAGSHQFTARNQLEWAAGINRLDADEPNRIRNEVNFDNGQFIQLGRTGGFQQRKSVQIINDIEYNGFIKDTYTIIDTTDDGVNALSFSFGGDFRNKQRDFSSQFLGLEEAVTNLLQPNSIDDLSSIFTTENLQNGNLQLNSLQPDYYVADLLSYGGFISLNYGLKQFNFNLGLRYQTDELEVLYDVGNIPGRIGGSTKSYENLYPSLNVRYSLNDKSNLRLATSKTITLPEFKEISPFEYVSATGQVTRGNQELNASVNYNFDLKWEYFPTSGELLSLTGFYKKISDPINKVQSRGAAGVFSYFNSAEYAKVYGLELETRLDLITSTEKHGINLKIAMNASRMWHSQDLKESRGSNGAIQRTFRYKGLTKTGLQGASNWIFNGSLSLDTNWKNPISAGISANYASDKIYALGAPEIQTQGDLFYNDAIIEKGFTSLDVLINQNIGEHWNFSLSAKNILNPSIERVQNVKPSTTGIETTEIVRSYTKGAVISLGANYKF